MVVAEYRGCTASEGGGLTSAGLGSDRVRDEVGGAFVVVGRLVSDSAARGWCATGLGFGFVCGGCSRRQEC